MYSFRLGVVTDNIDIFWKALLVTLQISVWVVVMGFVVGWVLMILSSSKVWVIAYPVKLIIEILRSLPALVLIFWFFYVIPLVSSSSFEAIEAVVMALGINLAAYLAEIFRSGYAAINQNQIQSARLLRINPVFIWLILIIPQAILITLPSVLGSFSTQIKLTALASTIGVPEILHQANTIIALTFRPLEVYTAISIAYIILILPLSILVNYTKTLLQNKFGF